MTEGAGPAIMTVTRTGTNLAGGIRVGYATSNRTATAGSDYTATSGVLTFGANVSSLTFAVPILNDVSWSRPRASISRSACRPGARPCSARRPRRS